MDEQKITQQLDNIQDALEKLNGEKTDFMFLSSNHNRGVINGTSEGLTALVIWNIARYPMMREIIMNAMCYYLSHMQEITAKAQDDNPSREIIDIKEL